ncbi:hypothetical protein RHMOL_Rhmol02G0305300 [Rhododendron molle]|uniref:Uncharacterized protein n=1 Tax=Rhododendron molle TaxID=49168 RepID=A0ACC0PXQ1_RHOML|nr:hypothetical protein RHMOL_Rhmol02G0305300 [Rhododendron molle]
MGMCREYNNKFYADAESGEDQLGLPGRVFLNKLPEYTPHVEHYTLKEYPQLDLALRCKIGVCWAVPVFEHSSHTCVGVLEIVSPFDICRHDKEFLGRMDDIFQKFGLRFFDGYEPYKMQCWDKNEARTVAFHELKMVSKSVCYIHNLPLALAWVSCHSCNDLLQSLFQFCVLYSTDENDDDLDDFMNVSKDCLLKKGQVTGRILPFPNLLYCSDVKQFSIAEFPLVPYARNCELGGWFTMCLQSSYTRDELYVLEFFLPKSDENDENILSKLRLILGTMEEYFKTFKLASGQGLGEALSVEVIDFQNGQKSPSIQMIPASRCIPSLELLQDGGVMLQQDQQDQPSMDVTNSGMYVVSEAQNYNLPILDSLQNGKVTKQVDSSDQQSMDPSNKGENAVTAEQNILLVSSSKKGKRKVQDEEHKKVGVRIEVSLEEILECSKMRREDAAKELKVSISKLKRVCRDFGINRWPPRNIKKAQPFRPLPVENLGQTPQLNCDLPSNQASTSVARIKPSFQDADKVTIRATCEKNTIKFRLSLSSRLVEMQQEVAKRLNLEGGTYYIKYKDEEDVLILIACDEDLQDCLHTSRSLDISSIANFKIPELFLSLSLQEFGLRCFDGYKHCKIQDGDENKALTTAFQELNMVYESVCKIHDLPLALTWVSCRSCNHLLQNQFQFSALDCCDEDWDEVDYNDYSFYSRNFIEFSKNFHLRKGKVAGRILSFPNLLYFSDVKQFHIDEFPLVHFARGCKLGGWFTMCLQSSYSGDELYVLEFFLPKSTKNDENILTKLRLILGTMEKNFKTFKLASGQGLGEALSVEVIDFQNGQKSHSIQMIPATRCIPGLELVQDGGAMLEQDQQDQPSMDVINSGMYVVSEAQNYNLPILDSLQNGKVTKQVDSSDQQSMDPSNKEQNVATAEPNILVVSSSKKGKRKTQDEEHKKAGVRIEVSLEEILKCSKMMREDAAKELKGKEYTPKTLKSKFPCCPDFSISTLKRVCRDFGIHRWPPRNIEDPCPYRPLLVENLGQTPQLNYDLPSNQDSASVAHIKPSFQDADMVTIRATCEKNTIKFRLSLSSRLVEMQQEVAKRLNLEGRAYYIKYKDEEDVLILIACDEDLQDCLHTSRSLGISSIAVLLELK